MDMLFIKLLNMSISASWVALIVLVLRLLLKNAPRWIHVALWALVAVRLICPVSIESVFSLIPSTQTVPEEIFYVEPPLDHQNATLEIVQPRPNGESVDVELDTTLSAAQTRHVQWTLLWPVGMAAMVLYALGSYLRLKRKVSASIYLDNGVCICDYIDTPFILGVLQPKIYLPSSMDPDAAAYVLAHERAHIARKDHWWKPLGYGLLTVYWFNPVLWLAYILLCRDIELACDEKVIRDMELPQKKAYSEALLSCSVNRRMIAACPLAFGEVGVKERVKTVLNYKKPAFWIVLVAIIALIVTAVCFLTDPVRWSDEKTAQWFEEYGYEQVKERMSREEVLCIAAREGYALVYCQGEGPVLKLYRYERQGNQVEILASCKGEYTLSGGMSLNHVESGGKHIYFGTISEYHYNPQADLKTRLNWDYLTIIDENGKTHKQDMTGKEGFLFVLDAPMADFHAVDGLETEYLNLKKFTEQGYYMVETSFKAEISPGVDTPYTWTSTVEQLDFDKAWARPYHGATYATTIEGSSLDELIRLLHAIQENEIVARKPAGLDDPLWNYGGATLSMYCSDGMPVTIRYADDTVIIGTDTNSDIWKTDGYWVIENEAIKQWMRSISLGGTDMLSDENREEIYQLLRMEQVQFFDPQEYDDLLFVGCAYDNGRGLGVAVFQKVAYGYKLIALLRDDEVKKCASGSELYYCIYNQYRIFLVLNQNITAMEWAGAYEATYAIDTHPGLIVEYFPQNLGSMYRFNYGGGATTMYMDWNNRTHGQVPDYTADIFANPDDPRSVCTNLRTDHVDFIWATEMVDVGKGNYQAHTIDLDTDETVQLLNLLHNLPEAAFEASDYSDGDFRFLDIYIHNYTGQQRIMPVLRFKLYENEIYYTLIPESLGNSQIWKINAPELAEYINSFFVEDKSEWHQFAPTPKIEGEVSCNFDGMEVYMPKLAAFEYSVTEEGIRFKPEEEEGWVLLRYSPEPFAVCGTGLKSFSGILGNKESTTGYYDNSEYWSFVNITLTSGDMAIQVQLINEEGISWVEEYDWEISRMIGDLTFQVTG